MTATWFSFGVGQFEASCFLQTPDSEVAHVKRSTNVEGHVLFIGREDAVSQMALWSWVVDWTVKLYLFARDYYSCKISQNTVFGFSLF